MIVGTLVMTFGANQLHGIVLESPEEKTEIHKEEHLPIEQSGEWLINQAGDITLVATGDASDYSMKLADEKTVVLKMPPYTFPS